MPITKDSYPSKIIIILVGAHITYYPLREEIHWSPSDPERQVGENQKENRREGLGRGQSHANHSPVNEKREATSMLS
jgi:hypothetical protein